MSKLTKHQDIVVENVVESCFRNMNTLLTGSAGTGKTFCAKHIIDYFIDRFESENDRKCSIIFTAPTHKAVSVFRRIMEEDEEENDRLVLSTTHSYLGLQPVPDDKTGVLKFIAKEFMLKQQQHPDLLIVEECSMISADMLKHLLGRHVHILFIGDSVQLSPVDEANSKRVSPVFGVPDRFQLTEIVRQAADNPIIKDATVLRNDIEKRAYKQWSSAYTKLKHVTFLKNTNEWLSKCNKDDSDKMCVSFTNNDVTDLNMALRYLDNKDIDDLPWIMESETLVVNTAHQQGGLYTNQIIKVIDIDKVWHERHKLWYWDCKVDKVGVKVKIVDIESFNAYSKCLDVIRERALKIKIPKDSTGKKAALKERGNVWKEFYSFKEQYLDIRHKYASTIHKSQGSTVDNVYINLQTTAPDVDMDHRLTYVAITRAREMAYILI